MCKVTSEQITADGAAVGQALDNIAVALQTTDPSLAANLKAAGDALIAATANWKDGDPLTDVITAENVAIVALNAIPVTSQYAPLVAIAFEALNLLIANAQTQPQQTENAMANAHMLLTTAKQSNTDSPWAGKAKIKHHFLNPPRKDFESAFNEEAPKVGVATITL